MPLFAFSCGAFALWPGSLKNDPGSRYFTLACLLIACAPCANNPLSIRHCAVFTPCERIPLSTIYSRSPRGLDCAVLFVCLPLFRRLTNNGPIAVIGDSASQTWFSMPLAICTAIQFSNVGLIRDGLRIPGWLLGPLAVWVEFPKSNVDSVSLATKQLSQMLKLNPERGKLASGWGWGCLSVAQKIPTSRESGFSSTAPMCLTRAGRGFLAR